MNEETPQPERKRRGRPALVAGEVAARVSVALPERVYDALYRKAILERATISAIIRRTLMLAARNNVI